VASIFGLDVLEHREECHRTAAIGVLHLGDIR
jgi:hypothetical protein